MSDSEFPLAKVARVNIILQIDCMFLNKAKNKLENSHKYRPLHQTTKMKKKLSKKKTQRKKENLNVILIYIPVFPPKGNCSSTMAFWCFFL